MSDRFGGSAPLGDDALRAAYADVHVGGPGGAHGADCPGPDALLAAARGAGDEAERLRLLDIALRCASCRRELALLHALSEPPRPRGEHGSEDHVVGDLAVRRLAVRGRGWGGGRLVPLAAAASLLLVAGVFGVGRWRAGVDSTDEPVRAAGTPGGDVVLVGPAAGATFTRASVPFAWHAVPGAFSYTLEVDAADGAVLYSARTADTALVAPLGSVAPGEHRWSVRARLGDGSERRSESRPLRLRR
jgi:hypothetical protein